MNMPTCMTYTPSQGYHLKKFGKALNLSEKCNTRGKDNHDKYWMLYSHDLMSAFEPHVDISATFL